ncbi:flagellar basal body protein, partial [Elstera litoralis]
MMSFSKALITGVTAMNAQSTAMGVLSNNIANSRTVGFKDSDSRFS